MQKVARVQVPCLLLLVTCEALRDEVRRLIPEGSQWRILAVSSSQEAIRQLKQQPVHLIVSQIETGTRDGWR